MHCYVMTMMLWVEKKTTTVSYPRPPHASNYVCCTCTYSHAAGALPNFCYTRLRGRPLRSILSSHAPLNVESIFSGTLFLGVVIIGIVEQLAHHRPDLVTRFIKKTTLQLKTLGGYCRKLDKDS
jgi:hypothetical protein